MLARRRGGQHWTLSPGGLGILAAAILVVFVGAARHGMFSSASGRPLPVTRQAAGWKYTAEHRDGDPSHLQWILTYRGEPVPLQDQLITPLGMFSGEPSRVGDTGPILNVSRNARKVPENGQSMTLAILTMGYYPSDCTTKPRGMPPDWSCRPDADEPGWIAPSILFGDRFRVEDVAR